MLRDCLNKIKSGKYNSRELFEARIDDLVRCANSFPSEIRRESSNIMSITELLIECCELLAKYIIAYYRNAIEDGHVISIRNYGTHTQEIAVVLCR